MRRLAFGTVALAVALIALRTLAAQSRGEIYVRTPAGEMAGNGDNLVEGPGDPEETYHPDAARAARIKALAATAPPYTFFPQAGTQGQDLFLVNYVDLGNAAFDHNGSGLDFACTDYSYAGHNGHDSIVDGFREQAIGVPVFAALNGTVIGAHDGEADQETVNLVGRRGADRHPVRHRHARSEQAKASASGVVERVRDADRGALDQRDVDLRGDERAVALAAGGLCDPGGVRSLRRRL